MKMHLWCLIKMKRLVFDVETDGLSYTKIWCIVAQDIETKVIYTYGPDQLEEGYRLLSSADSLVGHNIIGFDIPAIRKVLHKPEFAKSVEVLDTLVLSRLFNPVRASGHRLANWGDVLGFPKIEFQDFYNYSGEMLDYCVRDVELNTAVFHELRKEARGFSKDAIRLEHEVARLVKKQEDKGFYFNIRDADILFSEIKEKMVDAENQVKKVFLPKIIEKKLYPRYNKSGDIAKTAEDEDGKGVRLTDEEYKLFFEKEHSVPLHIVRKTSIELLISSRKQIGEYLQSFGWKPKEYTPNGRPVVNEKTLAAITDIPEAKVINDYFLLEKRKGQLSQWLEAVEERDDSRIHGYINSNGARTGRMTHSHPNQAQLPSTRKRYGKEFRALWCVPPGYRLVGVDASGLELRMLAHYMGDKGYINEIISGDIHTTNQKLAGLQSRDQAKTFIYALLYAAGDERLGSVVGGSKKTGSILRKSFLDNLPSFRTLKNDVSRAVAKNQCLKGLDGRKLQIVSEHSALNTLLQGAGAIVMKQALVILDEKLKDLDATVVGNVHDEWQIEAHSSCAEEAGQLGVQSIIEAGKYFKMRCPLDGEYKIGRNWSETH